MAKYNGWTTHSEFLQAAQATPDEDTPRLIYADWLEEQGDPYKDFIRLQCDMDAGFVGISRASEWQLFEECKDSVLSRIPALSRLPAGSIDYTSFKRGFLEEVPIPDQEPAQFIRDVAASIPQLKGISFGVGGPVT